MVTIYTTWFEIKTFCFLPTECTYVCLCGSQNKRLISQYIINLLVVIAETVYVSCVIRTESSNIIQVNVSSDTVKCNVLPPRI